MDRGELVADLKSLQEDRSDGNVRRLAQKYNSRARNASELASELLQFTGYLEKPKVEPRAIKMTLQADLDLKRYQGLWYEAARIPQVFDQDTPWATAEYELEGGRGGRPASLKVTNTAYQRDGRLRGRIVGTAVMIDDQRGEPANLSRLYVSFPTGQPMEEQQKANYLIHRTDYDRYAIVGCYDGSNLYILSRTRPMQYELYRKLVQFAAQLGYDISRLQEDYGALEDGDSCILC